jgi:hypothetical protein
VAARLTINDALAAALQDLAFSRAPDPIGGFRAWKPARLPVAA